MFAATAEPFDFASASESFRHAAARNAAAAGVTIESGTAEAKPAEAVQPGLFTRMSNSVSSHWEATKQLCREICDTPEIVREACTKAGYNVRTWGPFLIVTRPNE